MMSRLQISLDPESHARVRARAAALGVSIAEYVRRLVDRDLSPASGRAERFVVFDLGTSGGADIASNKDRMIGASIGAGKRRHSDGM